MGYLMSFMMFVWALLCCHNGNQDILAAGLFIGSAVFYAGAHLGALVESSDSPKEVNFVLKKFEKKEEE